MAYLNRLINCLPAFGFIWSYMLILMTPSAAADTIIYGGNAYERADMIEINLSANSSRRAGDLLFDTQAIGQDPATGFVYYFEWASSGNELAYWDPETNTNTSVRTYESTPWSLAKRAAFDPNGDLYLMDEEDILYKIDTASGGWQYIGQVEGIQTGFFFSGTGDIAFAPDGTLYLVTQTSLYAINMATLQATLLYSNMLQGSGWVVWTGLAFCDGTLYASHVNVRGGNSAVFRIDLDSGEVTQLINTGTMINDLTSCPAIAGNGNLPPVLFPIGDQVVKAQELLEFTVTATDPNPNDLLTYSAIDLPVGANFDQDTGEFSWIPDLPSDPDQIVDFEITFTVTDNGDPNLEDSETIIITVGNLPPELNPIGDKIIDVGDSLEFMVTATDPNTSDLLTYTAIDLPDDATFNQDTGEFSWTPNVIGQYTVTFVVTDEENLDDSETITIIVEEPKSGCGAAPMVRYGEKNNLSPKSSIQNALLPLLPSLMALGLWCVLRVVRRQKNR